MNVKANTLPPLPPPSPLVSGPHIKVTTIIKRDKDDDSDDDDDYDDNNINLRSKTLPPSKPPRITYSDTSASPQKPDEWETKLYGKSLEAGSTDSLKRRSWDNSSRVLLPSPTNTTTDTAAAAEQKNATNNPSPSSTPNFNTDNKRKSLPIEQDTQIVMPLPRSATLESIVEKDRDVDIERKEKPEKRLSKLNIFRKSKNDLLEDFKGKRNVQERIIIGHENDHYRQKTAGGQGNVELSQELIKKYEGRSREVIYLFIFIFSRNFCNYFSPFRKSL